MKPEEINILVGCEESQAVTIELRKLGFNAFSCDTQECSGGHPEWHIQGDVFEVINSRKWNAGIFFPPCTHLAQTGGRWFEGKRKDGRQKEGILFFAKIAACNIELKALENPKGILRSNKYIPTHFPELIDYLAYVGLPRKPDQVIQPYFFGHPESKETGLWLYGLPELKHTNVVEKAKPLGYITRKGAYRTGSKRAITWLDNVSAKDKSKTFPGIAKAMAEQWGPFILNYYNQ